MYKVAFLVGSLRKDSYNLLLAKHMQARYADRLDIEILDINLPLFNEDINTEDLRPDTVRAFHDKIEAADAVFMITPEYNHSVSGVLKNAIDWASRPGEGKKGLTEKVGLIASASMGATAGARAYINLLVTLDTLAMRLLPGNDIMVGAVHTQFDEQGTLTNEGTIKFIDGVIEKFIDFSKKF